MGVHPIFQALAQQATSLGYVQRDTNWDPLQFVDDVEQARGLDNDRERLLEAVQHAELRLVVMGCVHPV